MSFFPVESVAVAERFLDATHHALTFLQAVILAIVEGLTEYLPISSTGHLIITEAFMNIHKSDFAKIYIINIQFGAIFAVVVLYWRRFFQSFDFYFKLLVAFIPAAVIGFLLNDKIDDLLSSVTVVAVSLIVGGVILIFADKVFHRQIEDAKTDPDLIDVKVIDEFGMEETKRVPKKLEVTWLQAFIIGMFQCTAMIPGVSRSAATILGGLTQKLNIKRSAEFSFFLAVPTIFAASTFKLLKDFDKIKGPDQLQDLFIGNAISFVVGLIAIKFFIGLITHYGLKFFGYYRILLGIVLLALMAMGYQLEITE